MRVPISTPLNRFASGDCSPRRQTRLEEGDDGIEGGRESFLRKICKQNGRRRNSRQPAANRKVRPRERPLIRFSTPARAYCFNGRMHHAPASLTNAAAAAAEVVITHVRGAPAYALTRRNASSSEGLEGNGVAEIGRENLFQ